MPSLRYSLKGTVWLFMFLSSTLRPFYVNGLKFASLISIPASDKNASLVVLGEHEVMVETLPFSTVSSTLQLGYTEFLSILMNSTCQK